MQPYLPLPIVVSLCASALLSHLLGLLFSSPRKCLLIASSLLGRPSVSSFLPSLAFASTSTLLTLLETLLYPDVAAAMPGDSQAPGLALTPAFSAEDARLASLAVECFLQLSLKFPFVLRKLFFFSSARHSTRECPRHTADSPQKATTWCQRPASIDPVPEGHAVGEGLSPQVFFREAPDPEKPLPVSGLSSNFTFVGPERVSETSGRTLEEEEDEDELGATGVRRAPSPRGSSSPPGTARAGRGERDAEACMPRSKTRDLESSQPLVVVVLCGLMQDDIWENLDDSARWNSLVLVRLILLLARGTAPSAVLPSLIGAAGELRRARKRRGFQPSIRQSLRKDAFLYGGRRKNTGPPTSSSGGCSFLPLYLRETFVLRSLSCASAVAAHLRQTEAGLSALSAAQPSLSRVRHPSGTGSSRDPSICF